MQVSEAMAMGRTLLEPMRGFVLAAGGRGCALGMAGLAEGLPLKTYTARYGDVANYGTIEKHWPWLITETPACPVCTHVSDCYLDAIAHIFDMHVANCKPQWTLDQLIDWVRSVEPAEATPSPTEGANSLADARTELVAKRI